MSSWSNTNTKSYNASVVFKNLAVSQNGDVIFLVGVEKKIVPAIKAVLGSVSPVFNSMFSGDLREQSHVEVSDVSYEGFSNMIKLIHGYQINELNPDELIDTLMAVDKYLIDSLKNELSSCLEKYLDAVSACKSFDKAMGHPIEVLEKYMQANCKKIFNDKLHNHLSESSMMAILNMEGLDILEIDVIKAVWDWIEFKLNRDGLVADRDNKQKVFHPFKSLVRFSDLTTKEFMEHKYLFDDLLTVNEAYNLLSHLVSVSVPLSITYEGDRKTRIHSVDCDLATTRTHPACVGFPLIAHLKVNRKVFVQSIHTNLSAKVEYLTLICKVFAFDAFDEWREMTKLTMKHTAVADKWVIEFPHFLEMNSGVWYSVQFDFVKRTVRRRPTFDMFHLAINEDGEGHYLFKQNNPHSKKILFHLVTTEDVKHHCINRVSFKLEEE